MRVVPEFEVYLAQKILNLHPRGDCPDLWGVDYNLLPADSFAEIFGPNGIIETLNRFIPNEPDAEAEEDPYPPWSSGNLRIDYLADLTHYLGSFEQAEMVLKTLGIQEIANFLKRLSDCQKGPKEREKAGLKRWYWQHMREFESDFYEDSS